MKSHLTFTFSLLGSILWASSLAKLVNVTIDDSSPDSNIFYSPGWAAGNLCQYCDARPDGRETNNGTWHDVTFDPSSGDYPIANASATFNGTAVYVFCVLPRTLSSPGGDADLAFFLDGEFSASFLNKAPGTSGYDYIVTVFANTTLAPGFHTITLQNGRIGSQKSLALLDYIVYSTEADDDEEKPKVPSVVPTPPTTTATATEPLSSSSDVSVSLIAPAVAVPVVVLALAAGGGWLIHRRRRRGRTKELKAFVKAFPQPPIGLGAMPLWPRHPESPSGSDTFVDHSLEADAPQAYNSWNYRSIGQGGTASSGSTPGRPKQRSIDRSFLKL